MPVQETTEMSPDAPDVVVTAPRSLTEIGAAMEPTGGRARRLPLWLKAGDPSWTWLGVTIVTAGFVMIAVAWGQVAGETDVYLQLPYMASAGLGGLGLVIVGAAVLNVTARQRDTVDRGRQIDQLVSVMEELRATLAERERS